MKRKELTKTFMMISNWQIPWYLWFVQTYFSIVGGNNEHLLTFIDIYCFAWNIATAIYNIDWENISVIIVIDHLRVISH